MKNYHSIGRQLTNAEKRNLVGGKVAPGGGGGGGCVGDGPNQYTHTCTDSEGNGTGQVCCRGVAGGSIGNGVHCITLPMLIDLYVYCSS